MLKDSKRISFSDISMQIKHPTWQWQWATIINGFSLMCLPKIIVISCTLGGLLDEEVGFASDDASDIRDSDFSFE